MAALNITLPQAEATEGEVTTKDLVHWADLKTKLAVLKDEEMALRKKIYAHYFKSPVEGTNKYALAQGYQLKAQRVIDRKVDLGTLQAISVEGGVLQAAGINPNELIKWTPELVIPAYRALSEANKEIFEQALIIKDGSPQLEIVLPAAARKALSK